MSGYSDVAVFVRVAESSSFVRASESLSLSASAISKSVRRLEARLGARLLNRSTRSVRLTDLGEEYFHRCRDALGQLEVAESEVAGAQQVASGLLRIDAPAALGRSFLADAMPTFLSAYPQLRVLFTISDRPTELVQAGCDAAIRLGTLPDSTLIGRCVGRIPFITCASPQFLAVNGVPRTPADLQPDQCIGLAAGRIDHAMEWQFRRNGIEQTVLPAARVLFTDVEAAVAAARCHAGFVRALSSALEPSIAAGHLRPVLCDWNKYVTSAVHVVYPRHRQSTPKITAFVDFASSAVQLHEVRIHQDGCCASRVDHVSA